MEFKIKQDFADTYIAFGKEAVKLGKKSQSELRDLAILAKESGNPNLSVVFEGELKDVDVDALKEARANEQKPKKAAPAPAAKAVAQPPKEEGK